MLICCGNKHHCLIYQVVEGSCCYLIYQESQRQLWSGRIKMVLVEESEKIVDWLTHNICPQIKKRIERNINLSPIQKSPSCRLPLFNAHVCC